MGSEPSKEAPAPEATDASTKITEASSGFHMVEIHMPSMGMSFGLVILFALACLGYRAYRQHRREMRRWQQPKDMFSMQAPYMVGHPRQWQRHEWPGWASCRFSEVEENPRPGRPQRGLAPPEERDQPERREVDPPVPPVIVHALPRQCDPRLSCA